MLVLALALAHPARAEVRADGPGAAFDAIAAGHASRTSLKLLTDNGDAWRARWRLIASAKKRIDASIFYMTDDAFGVALLGQLLERARAGVKIRLLIDRRGSPRLTSHFRGRDILQELAATRVVEVRVFNEFRRALPKMLVDWRSVVSSVHDKILIGDDDRLVIGGRNLTAASIADPRDLPAAVRDADVELTDAKVAATARAAFEVEFSRGFSSVVRPDLLGNWRDQAPRMSEARALMNAHLDGTAPPPAPHAADLAAELAQHPHLANRGDVPAVPGEALVLDKATSLSPEHPDELTSAVLALIRSAHREVVIQSPFFVLSAAVRKELVAAAKRGVVIHWHTNGPTSTPDIFTQVVLIQEWKANLAAIPTLRLYVSRGPRQVHSKVMIFDGEVALVGSHNLDPLSEEVNSEVGLLVRGAEFARANRAAIEPDLTAAIEYRIRLLSDGTVEEVVGPSHHVPAEVLRKLHRWRWADLLRPVL